MLKLFLPQWGLQILTVSHWFLRKSSCEMYYAKCVCHITTWSIFLLLQFHYNVGSVGSSSFTTALPYSSSNIVGAAHAHFTWSPPFSSPEPVVSWSRGRLQIKPSGSGDENGSPLPGIQTSLSRWKCARKGRREGDNRLRLNFACRPSCRLYPSHGTLRLITRRSSTLRKTKRLAREEAVVSVEFAKS